MNQSQFSSLEAASEAASSSLGTTLFTVMVIAEENTSVARIFTTNSVAYPVGGRKLLDKSQTSPIWLDKVIVGQEAFVGLDRGAVRTFFKDHETIESLGCGCIINVPVISEMGVTIGSMNFLAPEGTFDEFSEEMAIQIAQRSRDAVQSGLSILSSK
jgi:hypothetical protein